MNKAPNPRNTKMITCSKQILLLLLATMLLGCISIGCNTYRGFGKDVSNTGDAIQDKK